MSYRTCCFLAILVACFTGIAKGQNGDADWAAGMLETMLGDGSSQRFEPNVTNVSQPVEELDGMVMKTYHIANRKVGEAGEFSNALLVLEALLPPGSEIRKDVPGNRIHVLTTESKQTTVWDYVTAIDLPTPSVESTQVTAEVPEEVMRVIESLAASDERVATMMSNFEKIEDQIESQGRKTVRLLIVVAAVLLFLVLAVFIILLRRKKNTVEPVEVSTELVLQETSEVYSKALRTQLLDEDNGLPAVLAKVEQVASYQQQLSLANEKLELANQSRMLAEGQKQIVAAAESIEETGRKVIETTDKRVNNLAKHLDESLKRLDEATDKLDEQNERIEELEAKLQEQHRSNDARQDELEVKLEEVAEKDRKLTNETAKIAALSIIDASKRNSNKPTNGSVNGSKNNNQQTWKNKEQESPIASRSQRPKKKFKFGDPPKTPAEKG